MSYDLIIIGGGTAGLGASRQAIVAGAKPLLISDGPIGGDCTWTGCVPSKTLISRSRRGVDFTEAIADVHRTVERIAATESADVLRSEGIDVIEGRARLAGVGRVVVDGSTFAADKIVVATGSQAARPSIPGLESVAALTNETLFELTALPKRLAILGGGALGCEMAMAFAGFGSHVTLIEAQDRLLPTEEPEASAVVERAMADVGVAVQTGCVVDRVDGARGGIVLKIAASQIMVDSLLLAAGRQPTTAGLGLESVGVELDARGHVVVDDRLRTTAAGIVAAGDVTGLLPFTHSADEQARMAVSHALRKGARWKYDPTSTPWVTFTNPEVARVGLLESQAPKGAMVAELALTHVDRAITDERTDGFVKLIAGPKSLTRGLFGGQLVGATIAADRAGEMIHGPALAARLKLFVGRLAQTTVAYPTYATAVQQAAGMFFQPVNGCTARPARR